MIYLQYIRQTIMPSWPHVDHKWSFYLHHNDQCCVLILTIDQGWFSAPTALSRLNRHYKFNHHQVTTSTFTLPSQPPHFNFNSCATISITTITSQKPTHFHQNQHYQFTLCTLRWEIHPRPKWVGDGSFVDMLTAILPSRSYLLRWRRPLRLR